MTRWLQLAFATTSVAGCARTPPTETTPQPGPHDGAPATLETTLPETAELDSPRWHRAARSGDLFFLHALDGGTFVSSGPTIAQLRADGRVDRSTALNRGISTPLDAEEDATADVERWFVPAFDGRWPEEAFLVTELAFGAADAPSIASVVHRWSARAGAWEVRSFGKGAKAWIPLRVRRWDARNMLALRGDAHSWAPVSGKELVVVRGPAKGPDLGDRQLSDFDVTHDGTIHAVSEDRGVVVTIGGAKRVTETPLPGAQGADLSLRIAAHEDEVFVYGGSKEDNAPYLAQAEGKGWSRVTPPPCALPLRSLAWQGETLWASCSVDVLFGVAPGGGLYARRDGDWIEHPLPDPVNPSMVATSDDVVWATAFDETSNESLLYRLGTESPTLLVWPDREAMHQELLQASP